jgi:hypothetical protein
MILSDKIIRYDLYYFLFKLVFAQIYTLLYSSIPPNHLIFSTRENKNQETRKYW